MHLSLTLMQIQIPSVYQISHHTVSEPKDTKNITKYQKHHSLSHSLSVHIALKFQASQNAAATNPLYLKKLKLKDTIHRL